MKNAIPHLLLIWAISILIFILIKQSGLLPIGTTSKESLPASAERRRIDEAKIAKRLSLEERQALPRPPLPRPPKSSTEEWVEECLREGAFHSMNVEFNQVRIDPFLWSMFTIEQKQGIVLRLSKYFDSKGSTGRVTILSNRNDNKLATYSVWSGIKILE